MKSADAVRRLLVSAAIVHYCYCTVADAQTLFESLDAAILNDLIEQYDSHIQSTCAEAATTISHDWPGTETRSNWFSDYVSFEEGLFQTMMSHVDSSGNKSWTIRIGTG